MQPFLSVIVPSYNEVENLKRGVIDEVVAYLSTQEFSWELILSDDGSTDGTLQQLHELAKNDARIRVLANVHAGKAPTVSAGMLAARGKWRLFTDFDQSTPISEIELFWQYVEQGYSVVIGSREMVGARRDKEPALRHVMGRGFNMLVQLLAVDGILDTQCGFKLFSAKATTSLFPRLHVYGSQSVRKDAYTGAFDVELLFLAKKARFKIREVPIAWHHNHTNRVSPLKDSFRMLRDIVAIRLADFRGVYAHATTR
jgi:dolichyl-phosphate beta-glucosyltransferase